MSFNSKPRVLFVIPRNKTVYDEVSAEIHTGSGYLTEFLKLNGIESKVVDLRFGYSDQDLLRFIDDFCPVLIGLTCYSFQRKAFYEQIRFLKDCCDIPLVIGGPHVSVVRKRVLEEIAAEYAVKGEGEQTLYELVSWLKNGSGNHSEIKGLIWRDGNEVVENPDRNLNEKLDSLPFPRYESFELRKYGNYSFPIITSRGCPYSCIFCSTKLHMGRRYRSRSSENVVAELEYWKHKGWNSFMFYDDIFTFDMKRAANICDLIIEKKLEISFKTSTRADRINEPLLAKMRKAGCVELSFGIESGHPEVLRRLKKAETVDDIVEGINLTRKAGIPKISTTFVIGGPGERWETFIASYNLAKSLPIDSACFFNLVPYPGAELFSWVENNAKFCLEKDSFLDEVSYW